MIIPVHCIERVSILQIYEIGDYFYIRFEFPSLKYALHQV